MYLSFFEEAVHEMLMKMEKLVIVYNKYIPLLFSLVFVHEKTLYHGDGGLDGGGSNFLSFTTIISCCFVSCSCVVLVQLHFSILQILINLRLSLRHVLDLSK